MREKLFFNLILISLVAAGVWGLWVINYTPEAPIAELNKRITPQVETTDVMTPQNVNNEHLNVATDDSIPALQDIKKLIQSGQFHAAAESIDQHYSSLSSDNIAHIKSLFLRQLSKHVLAKEYRQAQDLLINASKALDDIDIWKSLTAISLELKDWKTAVSAQLGSARLEVDPHQLDATLISLVATASKLRAEYESADDELSIKSLYQRLSTAHPGYTRFQLELAQSHLRLDKPELALPLLEQLQYDSELGSLATQMIASLQQDKQQSIEPEGVSAAVKPQNNRRSDIVVPLNRIGNSFVVNMSVNGRSSPLLLDTGASITSLSIDLIERLNLEPTGRSIRLSTANGITRARLFKASKIKLGKLSIDNLIVAEIDLKQNAEFQGLLGTDLLNRVNANYSYLIDNQQNALIFRRR